jgi:hypothetical protein
LQKIRARLTQLLDPDQERDLVTRLLPDSANPVIAALSVLIGRQIALLGCRVIMLALAS